MKVSGALLILKILSKCVQGGPGALRSHTLPGDVRMLACTYGVASGFVCRRGLAISGCVCGSEGLHVAEVPAVRRRDALGH